MTSVPSLWSGSWPFLKHWKFGFPLKQPTPLYCSEIGMVLLLCFADSAAVSKPIRFHSHKIQKMLSFGLCCTLQLKDLEMPQQHYRQPHGVRAWELLGTRSCAAGSPSPAHTDGCVSRASWGGFCLLIFINKEIANDRRVCFWLQHYLIDVSLTICSLWLGQEYVDLQCGMAVAFSIWPSFSRS